MNASVVVDASIGVSWVHTAQRSESSERLLNGVAAKNRIHVPALWPIEVANALLALERRGKMSGAQRARGVSRLASLPIEIDHHMVAVAWTRLSELAIEHRLSIYDAAYLELAQRRKSMLATRGDALEAAARAIGVQLWQ